MKKFDYSIVIPVYCNAGSLKFVASDLREKVLDAVPNLRGELIFVDDGSKDDSYAVLKDIYNEHPDDTKVFKLSRNYGQVNALWCGFEHASSAVVMISADGQDPVELIPEMLRKHFDEGFEVVIARRKTREESFFRRVTSNIVYWLVSKLSQKDMPIGGFDFVLLGKDAKTALLKVYQPQTFLQTRILDLGFKRAWLDYHRKNREHGKSQWSMSKKITYMLDGVLGHSYVPIRFISLVGVVFALFSFLLAAFFFISYFFNGSIIQGWTPIILSILFMGGLQVMMIGIIGEYIWRILSQVRQSPPYTVELRHEKNG